MGLIRFESIARPARIANAGARAAGEGRNATPAMAAETARLAIEGLFGSSNRESTPRTNPSQGWFASANRSQQRSQSLGF